MRQPDYRHAGQHPAEADEYRDGDNAFPVFIIAA